MWRQRLRIFFHNKLAVASVVYLVIMTLLCFLVPFFHPTNQTNQALTFGSPWNQPPVVPPLARDRQRAASTNWAGSSTAASTPSRSASSPASSPSSSAPLYGMISGFVGGVTDTIMMRFIDALLVDPVHLPAPDHLDRHLRPLDRLPDLRHRLHRVVGQRPHHPGRRAADTEPRVLPGRHRDGRAAKWHIIRRHVFPNSISNIVTVATFSVADAILFLSALGFLGLGIQAPQTDWGTMLQAGAAQIQNGFWWEIYPARRRLHPGGRRDQLHRRRPARRLRGPPDRALGARAAPTRTSPVRGRVRARADRDRGA